MGSGTSNNQINNYRMKTLVDERIRTEPCESKAFSPWEEMQVQRIKVNPKTNLLELVRKKQRRPFQEYRRTNLIDMFKPKQQIEVSVDQMLTSSRGPSLPKRRSLQPQQTLEVVQTSKLEKSINEEGNSQINQYTVVGTLGQGSFGKVKQAQNYKGELFAIKIANKKKLKKKLLAKSNAYSMLEREIAIMKKICHPNVVQLFEVIDDPDQDKLYLVMEYMGKGSILSKGFFNKSTNILDEISPVNTKNQLNEIKCRHYFRQFILGLDYLHQVVNVIHRDIKPENLLVSNDDILKIADFGVSHIMEEGSDGKISNQTGTQSFLAPEAFKGSNFDGKPVDVWAGGVTLYQMIYNKLPFPSMKPQELRQQILEDKFLFLIYKILNLAHNLKFHKDFLHLLQVYLRECLKRILLKD